MAMTFDLGSFLRGIVAVPEAALPTVENPEAGLAALVCQVQAAHSGAWLNYYVALSSRC